MKQLQITATDFGLKKDNNLFSNHLRSLEPQRLGLDKLSLQICCCGQRTYLDMSSCILEELFPCANKSAHINLLMFTPKYNFSFYFRISPIRLFSNNYTAKHSFNLNPYNLFNIFFSAMVKWEAGRPRSALRAISN